MARRPIPIPRRGQLSPGRSRRKFKITIEPSANIPHVPTVAALAFRAAGSGSMSVSFVAAAGSRPSYNTGEGFYIGVDMKLYDANNVLFRPRGVNKNHYDGGLASGIQIANTQSNVCRFQLYWANGTTPAQFVTQMTTQFFDNQIVAMPVAFWSRDTNTPVTCEQASAPLVLVVDDWVAHASDFTAIERWTLINIANEWGPPVATNATRWRDEYITAVGRMRTAGYLTTLVIDAGACGQDFDCIIDVAQAVFDADPQKNLLFSIHIYGNIQSGEAATKLATLAATGLPIVIGEFGPGRDIGPSPTDLTPAELMAAAEALEIGWIGWAFDDNDLEGGIASDDWFSMVYNLGTGYSTSNSADLTTWGQDIVLNPTYGLQALAVPATVFEGDVVTTVSDNFNRAGPGLGSNWTTIDNDINIASSTKAVPSVGGTHNVAYWNADGFGDDQFVECTITDLMATCFIGLVLRAQASGVNYYVAYVGSNNLFSLYKWASGSAIDLSGGVSVAFSVGDVVRLEVNGLNFTGKVNGTTVFTHTDTRVVEPPYTSGSPGLSLFGSVVSNAGADDWLAGPLSG